MAGWPSLPCHCRIIMARQASGSPVNVPVSTGVVAHLARVRFAVFLFLGVYPLVTLGLMILLLSVT